jgi:hypothetical protein
MTVDGSGPTVTAPKLSLDRPPQPAAGRADSGLARAPARSTENAAKRALGRGRVRCRRRDCAEPSRWRCATRVVPPSRCQTAQFLPSRRSCAGFFASSSQHPRPRGGRSAGRRQPSKRRARKARPTLARRAPPAQPGGRLSALHRGVVGPGTASIAGVAAGSGAKAPRNLACLPAAAPGFSYPRPTRRGRRHIPLRRQDRLRRRPS